MKKLFSLIVVLVLTVSIAFGLTVGSVQGMPALNFDLAGPLTAQGLFSLSSATSTAFGFGGRVDYTLKKVDAVSYGGYGLITINNDGSTTASTLGGGLFLKAVLAENVSIISDFSVLSIYSSGVAGSTSTTTFGISGASLGVLYTI